jgi:hypothetical protein
VTGVQTCALPIFTLRASLLPIKLVMSEKASKFKANEDTRMTEGQKQPLFTVLS